MSPPDTHSRCKRTHHLPSSVELCSGHAGATRQSEHWCDPFPLPLFANNKSFHLPTIPLGAAPRELLNTEQHIPRLGSWDTLPWKLVSTTPLGLPTNAPGQAGQLASPLQSWPSWTPGVHLHSREIKDISCQEMWSEWRDWSQAHCPSPQAAELVRLQSLNISGQQVFTNRPYSLPPQGTDRVFWSGAYFLDVPSCVSLHSTVCNIWTKFNGSGAR